MTTLDELRAAFAAGVTERSIVEDRRPLRCWLADHDPLDLPCSEKLERFHFIPRQRARNDLALVLPLGYWREGDGGPGILAVVEWDDRNGGIGCEQHHRRLDGQLGPKLVLPRGVIPARVEDFIADFGLEGEAERRFADLDYASPAVRT